MRNSAIGSNWNGIEKKLYTEDEIAESDLRVALMADVIKARQEAGMTQRDLEEVSGVSQPVIARMEKCSTSTQVDTLLKVLAAMGKTLAVVPIKTRS